MPGNGAIAGGGGWRTGSTITTITLNWSIRNINKRLSWLSWFWKKKAFQQQCYSIQLLLSLPAAPLRRVGPEQGSGVARVLPAEAAAEIIWGQYAASTLRALPYLHCNRNRWGPPNISNPQTHPEGGLEEPTVSAQKKPFLSFGTKVMCLWFSKTHGYSFPYWKWDHQTHSAKSPEIKILFLEALAGEFSHSVISDSLWPHGLQHTRLPCPLLSPGVCLNLCSMSQWCHPTISSSVAPFSANRIVNITYEIVIITTNSSHKFLQWEFIPLTLLDFTFLSHVWVNRTDDNSNWALSLGLGVENHPRTSCVFLLALVKFILSLNT